MIRYSKILTEYLTKAFQRNIECIRFNFRFRSSSTRIDAYVCECPAFHINIITDKIKDLLKSYYTLSSGLFIKTKFRFSLNKVSSFIEFG